MPATKQELEIEKLQLEKDKLKRELDALDRPFKLTPATFTAYFSALSVIVLFVSGFTSGWFERQRNLNEWKAERLERRKDSLVARNTMLDLRSDSISKRADSIVLNASDRIGFADSILNLTKRQADSLFKIVLAYKDDHSNASTKAIDNIVRQVEKNNDLLKARKSFMEMAHSDDGIGRNWNRLVEEFSLIASSIESYPLVESFLKETNQLMKSDSQRKSFSDLSPDVQALINSYVAGLSTSERGASPLAYFVEHPNVPIRQRFK